jgi:hypothetical protein
MKLALAITATALLTGTSAFACQMSSSFDGARATAERNLNTTLRSGASVSENGYTVIFKDVKNVLYTKVLEGKATELNWTETNLCGDGNTVQGSIGGYVSFTISKSGGGLVIEAAGQTIHAANLGGGDMAVAKSHGSEQ